MPRSDSYLTGSVLDGGEVKAGTKNKIKERALLEKMEGLLGSSVDDFVKRTAGATCESPDADCVGCNKHE